MASAQQISSYYASFGFRIDQSSLTKLKTAIKDVKEHISKQLNISVKISKFTIGKRELNAAIKDAATQAGGIRLSINSFAVNATELRRSVQSAFDKGVTLRVNATTRTREPSAARPRSQGGGNNYGTTGGVLNRYGISGLAGYATGVGVMNINSVSEDLQSSKVSLNTITGGRGVDAYQWIKNQGNQVGFDYRNQLPVFSSYLGASVNKQGYDNSLESYKNLTQYGLTHGSDRVSMERAMLAIGQMWSKGRLMAEELNGQLAEAKGFSGAKAIIAESYQESIGGKLTGQKAEAALIDAMKKGLVETAKVMPIATRRMGIEAAGGIDAYNNTTGAQHSRFTNSLTNAVEVFGKGGFDQGMMRFFKFMADFLDKHSDDIRELGNSFLKLEKTFERIVGVGERVIGFFSRLNPTLTNMGVILLPLTAIMSRFSMAMTGIALVMDDIDVYMSGGDSMIGRFVSYMKDLTGMDFTGLAAGFGVLAIGITAAFSPLIATIAAVAGLVEIYKYIQGLKSKEGVNSSQSSLPSWGQMDTQNAKNSTWGAIQTATGGYEGGGWNTDKSKGEAILGGGTVGREYRPALLNVRKAFDNGTISQDMYDRAMTAAGAGYSSPEALSSWINQTTTRHDNPNIFPASTLGQNTTFVINGEFNNVTMTLEDMIKNAGAQFTGGQQPAKSSGG